jgi:bifunctional DNA-binding transcriptional regulator/antitoxin component of YhaV-PrlF toxin-antitoxin module
MESATTVWMDEQGRITIPKPVRESFGAADESALLRLEITMMKKGDEDDEDESQS